MRIVNPEKKTPISILGLLMSKQEATRMIKELDLLIIGNGNYVIEFEDKAKGNGSSRKHIRICLYNEILVEKFDEKTKMLIKTGKL